MRLLLLALAIATAMAPSAYAGAWLQPEGAGLFIGQATYFTSSHYLDASGNRHDQPRFSKYEFQPYVEYGLCHNLTIGGSAFAQEDIQSGEHHSGLADPEIFVRTALWMDGKQTLSVQPLVKFASIYNSDSAPRGGSKSTDVELRLLYGRNLHLVSNRDYIDLEAAYRTRSGALNDQWRGDASLGLQVSEHWQLIPAIRGVASTGINHSVAFSENGDLDYDLLKAELTAAYHFDDKRAVQVTAFDHLAGRQTGDGYGISIGFAQAF